MCIFTKMCNMRTNDLLAVNGLMWTAIGTKITVTGVSSYLKLGATPALWWMIPLSLLVFAGFYGMFTGVVRKYSARIFAMPGPKQPIYKTFSVKGYLIIAFMISLGIIGFYVARIYEEIKGRPRYIVAGICGREETAE